MEIRRYKIFFRAEELGKKYKSQGVIGKIRWMKELTG